MSFQMQEFRLGIQFGPSIRFIQPRPSRIWGMKTISNQYGINIRFRNKKSDGIYKSGRQINDSSNFINVAELIMAYLGQTDPISQGSHTGSTYMNTGVGVNSGTSSTIPLNSFRSDQLDVNDLHGVDNEIFIENSSVDTDLHFNEDDQHIENKNINNYNDVNDNNNYDYSLNNQPIIQIKLIYFMLRSNSSKIIPYSMNNLINLNVPRLLMHSNNMHIFVQFEPRDIIEPPWFPAISTPEPRKLRIIGLIPQSPALPLDSEKIYSFPFSIPPIGRLVDLTRSVFCRPATSRGLGDNLLEVITSSSPACSISMRQAPPEIENIGSFSNDGFLRDLKVNTFTMAAGGLGMRVGWTDQLVLALPSSVEQNYNIPVAPSIYGSVSLDQQWSWRDWRGPTVRRWMLEGFQIHATKTVLRKIKSWKIPSASSENNHLPHPEVKNRLDSGQDRYEQALITVTARIYTMKPGTGQRIYLGSSFMDKQQFSIPSSTDQFHTHEDGSSEMIFDITRLLPSWALVVKSTKFHQSSVVVDSESPAYLYHDTFNGKPQIIGRRPGKVELNLVATLGDFQPLATLLIDIIDFTELSNQPGSVYTDNPDIVAIKAECIDSSLELSGSLNPAAATHNHDLGLETVSYDSYKKLSSDILDGREYGIPITKIQDYSLPNPHRLNIHLIGRSLKSSNLVTAAASSTIRHPQSFKFKLIQTNQNAARIMDTMRPSVSSAVCPIHLLVINLILSDGSTISAHTVPKINFEYLLMDYLEEGQQSTNITIPINSLIIWPAILTNKSKTTFHSLPLAIMDDVFVYIRKSGMIEDPGYPQNPLKWFMKDEKDKVSEKMLLPNSKAKNHHIVGSNTGSLLQFNTLLTISNTDNSLKSNNSTNQSVPIITYILIIIGCLIIIILMIICCIIIIFRKKHLKQTKLDDKSQLNALPGYNNNHNNNNNNFNKKINDNTRRLINNDQLILSQLISSTEDQSIQSIIIPEIDRISKSSSECLKNRIQLNSEEICNSINSNKSATFITNNNNNNNNNNNGKHSMIIDTTINPYFICSESLSSNRDQHISQYTYSTNLSPINNLSGLTNYSINYNISTIQDNWNKSNENQSIHSNHQYKIAYYNSENINQCLLWPINNHLDSQLYPKDYTSGLGSVGTVEGCSDEGVASGIEMNSLSQEINNNNNNSNSGIGYFPIKYKLDVNSQQKQTQTTGYRSADESFNVLSMILVIV
ncbi:unnamed protein product [Heterobilharzia americana]|nr:unnamed protein product [Heterobilharzia americana]